MPPDIDLDAPPADVYAAVAGMDGGDFEELMQEPRAREKVIDALVDHFAHAYRGGEDVEAVIHVKLWDRPGGGYDHRELVVSGGRCTITDAPEHDPRLTLKVRPGDLRAIVTGESGPRRLALRGRLRVLGDIGLAMKLPDLFDLG